jgi:uncharacterized protein DUF2844
MESSSRLWTLITLLLLSVPAFAALGGDTSSVTNDQLRMQATLHSTQSQGYAVHELRAASGNTVREYVSPQGKVFALAWEGPFRPDFQQLLGTYFQQFADSAKNHRRGSPLVIEQPGLVVYSGGHMRAFFGKAYVPDMMPQGVTANDIK